MKWFKRLFNSGIEAEVTVREDENKMKWNITVNEAVDKYGSAMGAIEEFLVDSPRGTDAISGLIMIGMMELEQKIDELQEGKPSQ